MKESVLNTRALATSISSKATATTTTTTDATTPVTRRLGPVGTNNRVGYYQHVTEPLSDDCPIGRGC